jgi:integrase
VASVRKRPGSKSPWLVSYRDHTGTQRYRQFRLRADADAHALSVERAKQNGGLDLIDAGRETVRDYGAKFFAARKAELAPATAKTLASIWNAHVLDSALAGMQLRGVRPSDVQAFKVGLLASGVGDGSTRKALGLLSQVFDAAALDGIVGFNPCAPVKRPSGARKGDIRVIAPDGVERLRARLDAESARVVSLMAYAGLRPEELRALRWRHIGERTIRVEFACNADGSLRDLKGSGERRSVPLCAALAADLAPAGKATDLLFSVDGRPWSKTAWDNFRSRKFKPAAEAAGLDISRPYELRHSIASLWLRSGVDQVTVAGRLGHSVAVLSREYAHVIGELDPDDRRTVDEMIAAARSSVPSAP